MDEIRPKAEEFEHWDVDVLANIPTAEDDKNVAELLAEFKAGQPPQKRGRRIPFVLFHRQVVDSVPVWDEEKKKILRHERKKRNSLQILDCSGSHAQESVIQYYAMKPGCKGVLAYWFPNTQTPKMVPGSMFGTTSEKQGLTKYSTLARYCEMLRGTSQSEIAELSRENEALRKQLEEKAAMDKKVKAAKADKNADT